MFPFSLVEPLIGGGQVSALEPGVSTVRVERSSAPTLAGGSAYQPSNGSYMWDSQKSTQRRL